MHSRNLIRSKNGNRNQFDKHKRIFPLECQKSEKRYHHLKFGIKYRNKSSISTTGSTDQKLLWNLSFKKNEKERKTNERPGFNGLFNEREHQAAGKASGDGRNLRLLVPGISGTEKTE